MADMKFITTKKVNVLKFKFNQIWNYKNETTDVLYSPYICGFINTIDDDLKDFRGRTVIDEATGRARFSSKPQMKGLIEKYYPEIVIDLMS